MRKYIITAAAPITQRGADSTHCEVPGRDACSGDGRSAQSSCFVSETLTARQRDVLAMISQGLTNKRIARACKISPETVKSHVKHIFSKLAVSTRAQALFRAGSLDRAQIPIPPAESGVAQTPASLKPHGEGRRFSQ